MRYKLLAIIALLMIASFQLLAQDAPEETPETASGDVVLFHENQPDRSAFELTVVAEGFYKPLFVTNAGDDSGRLFVVEQTGQIWIIDAGSSPAFLGTTFLDLSGIVTQDGSNYSERGLLGLAFHPDYANNGLFYVNFTASYDNNATKLVEYHVSDDNPNVANPESARELITVNQPYANHNGGHLAFGPDGMLYIAVGDGGRRDDPLNAGQTPDILLGKLLRIDIDNTTDDLPYGIPEDNPFTINNALAPEVWAWGVRNPWRFSFDRATGDLYIADVGQDVWEEVNFQPTGNNGGQNYGWNDYEASHRYLGDTPEEEVEMPVIEYSHSLGCSITGGYVYRGENIPQLNGYYLFGDFCSGTVWAAYRDSNHGWHFDVVGDYNFNISSFGEDEDGELYILDYINGRVFRFDPGQ